MAIVESECLILKSYPLSEADRIVVFLTQRNGLLRGVAKGAKRLKSRFGGALEPFSVVKLNYYQKEERELVTINDADLHISYFAAAGNPEFLQKFSYLSDLLIEFAPPGEPNEKLYRMATACLSATSTKEVSLSGLALYFEVWILRLCGFLPDWRLCDGCNLEIDYSATATLQINYHLLCPLCQKSRNGMRLKPTERKIFFDSQILNPTNFASSLTGLEDEIKEVSDIMKRIISHILGKENFGERVSLALPLIK